MKYDVKKALEVPLSAYEKEIEGDLAGHRTARPALAEELQQAAKSTLRKIRGGMRTGSGRKPRTHVRTTVLLAPPLRRKLDAMATREGSLSAAVEKLIRAAQAA